MPSTTRARDRKTEPRSVDAAGGLFGALPPNPKLYSRTERRITLVVRRALREQRRALLDAAKRRDVQKFDLPSEHDLREFLHAIEGKGWNDRVAAELRGLLGRLAKERAAAALAHTLTGAADEEIRRLVEQANMKAIAWADARVGNLITDVSHTTRQAVNVIVGDSISEGTSNAELAERLAGSFEFSDSRALMIARTETALAETQGTLTGYRESGVVAGKAWSADGEACDVCEGLDGEEVSLEGKFSDGSDGPPAHPNCRCVVVPVLFDDPH